MAKSNTGGVIYQPSGEIRCRTVIQRWNGSGWVSIVDTGYYYNTTSAWGWLKGYDMGAYPDGGVGTYRVTGYGWVYDAGLWRGGYWVSPSRYMN
jgi:hypothetical protein